MIEVKRELCTGCGKCMQDCFSKNIRMDAANKAIGKNVNCIKCGHCIAICPNNAVVIHEYDMSEVRPYVEEEFKIDAERFLNFIKFRRAVRQFLPRTVEQVKIEQMIDAGRFTQTGGNRQSVSYIILQDKKAQLRVKALECLHKISDEYINSNIWIHQRFGKNWKKMYERFIEDTNAPDELFFDAPLVILVVSDMPTHAGLAAANVANMANALGLGVCFVNFFVKAIENDHAIRQELDIPDGHDAIYCLTVGYPAVEYLRTVPRRARQLSWK